MDNRCNKFLPFFALLDKEFSPGNCLCDNFPDYFSFYPWLHNVNDQLCKLNNITIQASLDSSAYIVISDASIKNQVATLVSHVYSFDRPIVKTFHQAVNISTTETELFTIRCGINQTIGIPHIKCIIIITDSLYATKKIFDSSLHPYQLHSATISHELREFFNKDIHNHIKFWDCSSNKNWLLHSAVNKDSKSFNSLTSFPYKSSWDFSKKHDCDDILS